MQLLQLEHFHLESQVTLEKRDYPVLEGCLLKNRLQTVENG